MTRGFKTPSPSSDAWYWREDVSDVVLATGFSNARSGESAPKLRIREKTNGFISQIQFDLFGDNGALMAHYAGRFRTGHPNETKDGVTSSSPTLAFEYLLHGNFLNSLAAQLKPNGEPNPLMTFLSKATRLSHPQGSQLGLTSRQSPPVAQSDSVHVELEVLEERKYDPIWVIKEDRQSNKSKWSELSWDSVRGSARCKELLKPELKDAPQLQTWHLFVNDLTGRNKVRYTGNAICDPEAIWFLDYVVERGRTTLTKYSSTGDFLYRLSFQKPNEPRGFAGHIMIPTFTSKNGYLEFEWWNTNQSGWDRHIARSLRVRIQEPQENVPKR